MKLLQSMYNGDLEILKQNSAYVVLKRNKRKIDINSKIINPFKIRSKVAGKQITTINDFLIILIAGIKKGYYSYDNETIERALNKHLYKKLNRVWKIKSKKAKQELKKIGWNL